MGRLFPDSSCPELLKIGKGNFILSNTLKKDDDQIQRRKKKKLFIKSQLDGAKLTAGWQQAVISHRRAPVSLGVAGLAGWCMCFLSISPELCSLGHCADLCSARSHTSFGSWILPPLSLNCHCQMLLSLCVEDY